MSKVTPRKLTIEDFKDQQAWIGKLLSPLNDFIQQTIGAFSNGLTVEDNLFREIRELKFVVDAGAYPQRFRPKFKGYPKGINLIDCRDSNGADLTTTPFVNWRLNNDLLEVTSVVGLTSGHTYILRLEVIYG